MREMKRGTAGSVGLIGFLILWSSIGVLAQTAGTSRANGLVVDSTGAVVPDAKVVLTNEGTNNAFTAMTTSAGVYAFESVQLGSYTLTVEKPGFKKFISRSNVLSAGQPLTINVDLAIGNAQETVEVFANYERVPTSTSGNFGTTMDNKTLTDLPLGLESGTGGRNALIFVRLQPGVVTGANTGGGSHVNGARDRAFNYTLEEAAGQIKGTNSMLFKKNGNDWQAVLVHGAVNTPAFPAH